MKIPLEMRHIAFSLTFLGQWIHFPVEPPCSLQRQILQSQEHQVQFQHHASLCKELMQQNSQRPGANNTVNILVLASRTSSFRLHVDTTFNQFKYLQRVTRPLKG